jgi:hypothetical protein
MENLAAALPKKLLRLLTTGRLMGAPVTPSFILPGWGPLAFPVERSSCLIL